jgi:lipoprotein-anchoring transpeptidase ErfK/SrfK
VMAVQKAAGLTRDGVMGTQTRKALASGVSVDARSTSGRWIEIDKAKQLVKLVDDGQVQTILNTSTGSGETYDQEGKQEVANTPSGKFEVFRQIDALHKSPLGLLWRPKFFNGGIALHGAESIPAYPASHGCVRLSNAAMNWIWDTSQAPIGSNVWVY